MTTQRPLASPAAGQTDRHGPPPARDISINDFTRVANPKIYSQYVLVQTPRG